MRCLSRARALAAELVKIYDAAFPEKAADDKFWSDVDRIEKRFTRSFEEPVNDFKLRSASAVAVKEFREACSTGRKR